MGVVYKAEDTKLRRIVALKFLAQTLLAGKEDRQRFAHEAQAFAALNHPNVATIFEIDQSESTTFIAFEYIEGQNLAEKLRSGPLKLEEAVSIAIQTSDGLQAAHEKDIVHRDVKSQNIMVTPQGQVKILDFGLAKLRGASLVTKAGTIMGTMGIMSPEQLRGEPVDRRTDIWALGVVLYEMVAGRKPFQGDYEDAVAYRVLNEQPEPLTAIRTGIPMELERIVDRMLQKDRAKRYQHCDELLVDLRSLHRDTESGAWKRHVKRPARLRTKRLVLYSGIAALCFVVIAGGLFLFPITSKKKADATLQTETVQTVSEIGRTNSIAVLPFKNISSEREQEYFCDGMTEQIITNLSNVRDLKVIARTSVMQFKNSEKPIPEIGRQLGVANILEGSIRKSGNHIRVTAQLINANDGFHLWAKDYDRELKDIFAVQDDVSKAIVAALKINLSSEQSVAIGKRYTEDTEAYQLYLKGRYEWNKRTEKGLWKSVDLFRLATQKDQAYALAYAGLSQAYAVLGNNSFIPPDDAFPKARAAALKALELDDNLDGGHIALGMVLRNSDWDWSGAEREYRRAIQLNPNSADAHHVYGILCNILGRHDQAVAEVKRARELDPLAVRISSNVGDMLLCARKYDEAIQELRKALDIHPDDGLTHIVLGRVYLQKRMVQEALVEIQTGFRDNGAPGSAKAWLAYALAVAGRTAEARKALADLLDSYRRSHLLPYQIAIAYAGLGEREQTLAWLVKAYQERDPILPYMSADPALDPLHDEPRFRALLQKMRLSKS